ADADGAHARNITTNFDRDVQDPRWAGNGSISFLYSDHVVTKIARNGAGGGAVTTVLSGIGGTDLGRPYTGGAYSVNASGRYLAPTNTPTRPPDTPTQQGRPLNPP